MSHEAVEFAQVMTRHVLKHVDRELEPHKSDFGRVMDVSPVLVKIVGKNVTLHADMLFWADGSPAIASLQIGDFLALSVVDGSYIVHDRVQLGADRTSGASGVHVFNGAAHPGQVPTARVGDLYLSTGDGTRWQLASVTGAGVQTWTLVPYPKPPFITFASAGIFAANWSDYGSFARGGYAVDAMGFCTVRGLVKKATTYGNETIATLPVLPSDGAEIFNMKAADSVMGAFIARVDVNSDGRLLLNYGDSVPSYSTPGSMSYLSLSGIRFQVA